VVFLWTLGGPQYVSQVENRFERSTETISRKFKVLEYVFKLGEHIIKGPQFTQIHPRLEDELFSPHFNGCIGAIDGTHISVIVLATEIVSHIGRHWYTSQNVLAICDFDLRFTFVVARWLGSTHNTVGSMTLWRDMVRRFDVPAST
jgi:hypothetical protein